jgi:adenosine kinase
MNINLCKCLDKRREGVVLTLWFIRYKELVDTYKVVYVAGGAAQNTARGAQYIMPPNSTVYMGAVSNDAYAETIKNAAEADGLKTNYQIITSAPTGTCAALITGHDR